MKCKLSLIIYFIVQINLGVAQTFGDLGSEWYYSEHNGGAGAPNSEFVHFKSVLDTVINGISTHKITQEYFRFNGKMEILPSVYVYQKTDTAFMFSFEKSKFLKLYIFNAKKGDTLTLDKADNFSSSKSTYRLVIDSIQTISIKGVFLKYYRVKALDFYGDSYFDRVGCQSWFFPRGISIPEAAGPIRCFKDSQIDTNFQKIACDRSIFSIEKINKPVDIGIFPNPVNRQLSIQIKETLDRIEIYDLFGKLLITTGSENIDFSAFNEGVYIIKIHLHSGVSMQRKVLKIR